AEEAGRIGVKRESPPELVLVLHVLVGEEPQPHRGSDHHRDRQYPAGLQRLRNQCGLTVEVTARWEKRPQDHGERKGFLPVCALEQRSSDTYPKQGDSESE